MTIPAPPWWVRILTGGSPQNYALAGVSFMLGFFAGKGINWQDIARSADRHWHKEYGWHDNQHYGKHTEREHERDNHRQHSHER